MNNIKQEKNTKILDNKKKSKNLLIIFIPIIFMLIASLFLYIFSSSSIEGKIISSGDNKILLKGVKITLDNNKEILNRDDSTYNLSNLNSGNHTLKFKKTGFDTLVQNITLEKNQNLELNIYLIETVKSTTELISRPDDFITLTLKNILLRKNNSISIESPKCLLIINSKIYILEGSNIKVYDYSSFKEINNINLPQGLKVDKLSNSSLKDKIYLLLKLNNAIGVVDINTNRFLENTSSLNSEIKDIVISKDNNRSFIITDNEIYPFNVVSHNINELSLKGFSVSKAFFSKNYFLITDKLNKSLIKVDFYNLNKEPIKYDLNFNPENIVVTKSDKVYISSGKNIYLIDVETGNTIKSFDIGININDIKVSPKDDNIYITDNSPNVYVFDTNKDELNKDKFTFKENIKEIFFQE